MKKNERNAGAKPKFKPDIKTKVIRVLIPTENESEILSQIEKIVKPLKNKTNE